MDYNNHGQIIWLATKSIKVRVEFITSIDIPLMNDWTVFVPSVTWLNTRYKFHDEIFVHAIGPLSF